MVANMGMRYYPFLLPPMALGIYIYANRPRERKTDMPALFSPVSNTVGEV